MKKIIMILIATIFFCTNAYANGESFFYDSSCGTDGDGTLQACTEGAEGTPGAWNALASVIYGSGDSTSVDAGDTLFVCGSNSEKFSTPAVNGIAGSPIVVNGDCPGDPGTIAVGAGETYAFVTNGESYWTLKNITLSGGSTNTAGITSNSSGGSTSHITLDNVTFVSPESNKKSLYISNNSGYTIDNITIKNSTFTDSPKTGSSEAIRIEPNDQVHTFVIKDNIITGYHRQLRFYVDAGDNGKAALGAAGKAPDFFDINGNEFYNSYTSNINIQTGLSSIRGQSYIRNNILSGSGLGGVADNVNSVQAQWFENVIIEYNNMSGVDTASCDGSIFMFDWAWTDFDYISDGNIFRYNVLHDAHPSGCRSTGALSVLRALNTYVYGNIIYDADIGINIGKEVQAGVNYNTHIYNNTVYDISGTGANHGLNITNSTPLDGPVTYIRNNIFSTMSDNCISFGDNTTYNTYDHNLCYSYSALGFTAGATDIDGSDPMFVNTATGYLNIFCSSPAVDAGYYLELPGSYNGVLPDASPNMGAYQNCFGAGMILGTTP